MRRGLGWMALVAPLLAPVGCTQGLLYTHVITPLDTRFDQTPVQDRYVRDDTKRFQYRIRVEWGDEGIGKIARRHGLTKIYYADLERRSFLGIWTQRWVRVYGE